MTSPITPIITTLTATDPVDEGKCLDTEAVAQLMAVAFNEPVTRWLVPDPDRRHQVMASFFTLMADDALASRGRVDVVTNPDDTPVAAAIWFDYSILEGAPAGEPDPRFDRVFGEFAPRWRLLDDLMTAHHLNGPHMYLFAIGVHPEHQGKGHGSRLLAHGHRLLKGVPAYLEATSVNSRRLYARHGYRDLSQIHLADGPVLWRMLTTVDPMPRRD